MTDHDAARARAADAAYIGEPLHITPTDAARWPQPPAITQLPLPTRREPWVERAACRGLGHEFFYGASRAVTAAKAICNRCPVITPCLEEALKVADRDDFGVWGGTTREERRAIKRQRKDVA